MKKIYSFFVLLVFAQAIVYAQRVINLNDDNIVLKKSTATAIPQEYLKEAKSARTFALNPVLQRSENVSVGDIVNLQLFENQNYNSTISNITTDVNGTLTLTLKLPEYPMAYALIITGKNGKSFVSVSIPEFKQYFGSRYNVNSSMNYLVEIDENKRELPNLENDAIELPKGIEIPIGNEKINSTISPRASKGIQATCTASSSLGETDPATIDLLIVYTPAAATTSYVSNRGGIDNVIASMIGLGNLCLSNSNIGMTLCLARSVQVDYTEADDMYISLPHLQNPSDGYMDDVHALRKQYNADLVQLLTTDSNSGGLGYTLNNSDYATEGRLETGFSVCWVEQVGDNYPCSVHELGHNMGLGHGAQQTSVTANGIFPYSRGWRWQGSVSHGWGNNYYTSVMSYQGNYYGDGLISQYTPYFSNPNINYLGAPTGNATVADAARSLREMKHVIAFYSDKLPLLPSVPTNIVVSNPTAGGATISWDACDNATEYVVGIFVSGSSGSYYPLPAPNPSLTFNYTGTFASCTTYWFFVQAINECGDAVSSSILPFTTKCATDPTVTTLAASNITDNSATLNKTVVAGSETILEQGFYYKKPSDSNWILSTTGNLTGLTANTEYKFYAYAKTVSTNVYNGSILTFATSACDVGDQVIYTITAQDAFGDGWNNASLLIKQDGINLVNLTLSSGSSGSETVSFCLCMSIEFVWQKGLYDYECSFVIKDNFNNIVFATPAGSGSSTSAGCAGYTNNQTIFTTSVCIAPTVTTLEATNITTNSATLNKTIVAGSEAIAEEGFYYKESSAGETAWTLSATGALTELSENTEYGFYAYATTASGTVNGGTLTFTTGTTTDIDVINANNVVIFPNPAKDELRIMNYKLQEGEIMLITDISGKVIKTFEPKMTEEIKIDISTLPQGIYFLKINNFTGKFIKGIQ